MAKIRGERVQATKLISAVLLSLIAITIALLLWQFYGMNQVFRIDARQAYGVTAIDDRNSGGKSWAAVRLDHGVIEWECHVRTGFAWPFCELGFVVGHAPQGLDFSRFDSFVIRLQHSGNGPRRLRLFLRNFEPGQANLQDPVSWRQNELQFDAPETLQDLHVPMRHVSVASWWLANQKIPMGQGRVDVSNVPAIQLSTSGLPEDADQTFRIEFMEFRGKRFSLAEVALGLLGMWVAAGLTGLAAMEWRRRIGTA